MPRFQGRSGARCGIPEAAHLRIVGCAASSRLLCEVSPLDIGLHFANHRPWTRPGDSYGAQPSSPIPRIFKEDQLI
jgi:hypothetical protein